jgi:hypothetical protein
VQLRYKHSNEINFSSKMNNTKLSTYSFDQMEYHGLYKKKFQLSLSLDKSFYGRTVFSVRGFDRDKFTTKTLEVNAYRRPVSVASIITKSTP